MIKTYEVIMSELLSRVSDNLDKREGSIIYDALSPCAMEIAEVYQELEELQAECYGDTASLEYLTIIAGERGITRRSATNSYVRVTHTDSLGYNTFRNKRFSGGENTYICVDYDGSILNPSYLILKCEQAGTQGNIYQSIFEPIDFISGIGTIEYYNFRTLGSDIETIEDFRKRYLDSFNALAFGGNKKDYHEKCITFGGVGGAKISNAGAGAVSIYAQNNTSYGVLPSSIINSLQAYFYDAVGGGIAPIGHVVTVNSVTAQNLTPKIQLVYESGYSWANVGGAVQDIFNDYALELNKLWDSQDHLIMRVNTLIGRIIEIEGIVDVTSIKLQSTAGANCELTTNQVFGTITVSEGA